MRKVDYYIPSEICECDVLVVKDVIGDRELSDVKGNRGNEEARRE